MQAQITLKTRDLETGEVVGEQATTGHTEDGRTFIIPQGYLPGIVDADANDVHIEVIMPIAFSSKSVAIDEDGNTVLSLTS